MTPQTTPAPVISTDDFFEAAILRQRKAPFERMDGTAFIFSDADEQASLNLKRHRAGGMMVDSGELHDAFLWVKQQIMNSPTIMTGRK